MSKFDEPIKCDNVADTIHQLSDEQTVEQINPAAEPDDGDEEDNVEVEEAKQPKPNYGKPFEALCLKLLGLVSSSTELDKLCNKMIGILLEKTPASSSLVQKSLSISLRDLIVTVMITRTVL